MTRPVLIAWILRISGLVLLVSGLQSWAFHGQVAPLFERAERNLQMLREEVTDDRLLTASLETLRDYRRRTNRELRRRQILELREMVVQNFRQDPRAVIDELLRAAGGFEPESAIEREVLADLQMNLSQLQDIYADHYAAAINVYTEPPWYLQPTAALLGRDRETRQRLDFNHALYLMLAGDRAAASTIYHELRPGADSGAFEARILFAEARLQYAAYSVDHDPAYHRQAVQYAQQSLGRDPGYDLPKLFLEFLLSIEQQAMEIDSDPEQGEGAGEGEGERGAISTQPREF